MSKQAEQAERLDRLEARMVAAMDRILADVYASGLDLDLAAAVDAAAQIRAAGRPARPSELDPYWED